MAINVFEIPIADWSTYGLVKPMVLTMGESEFLALDDIDDSELSVYGVVRLSSSLPSHLWSRATVIALPDCIEVGNSAFYSCTDLTTVSLPVCTSVGSSAFETCIALAAVSFKLDHSYRSRKALRRTA